MAFPTEPQIGQLLASNKLFIVLPGISDPSSASKTMLAYLLSSVFTPHVQLILYSNDSYKDISLIPTNNGYIDVNGSRNVDFEKLIETLNYVKASDVGNQPMP